MLDKEILVLPSWLTSKVIVKKSDGGRSLLDRKLLNVNTVSDGGCEIKLQSNVQCDPELKVFPQHSHTPLHQHLVTYPLARGPRVGEGTVTILGRG